MSAYEFPASDLRSRMTDVPSPQAHSDTRTTTATRRRQPPPWNVVLVDDDDHTYEYVMRLAQELFGQSRERAYQTARTVDTQGRVVLLTTHKEHAELKREQVLGFGRDPMLARSAGPMTCIIEPAEFQGDEDNRDEAPREDGPSST